jgi:hypothetical protein
MVIFSHKFSDFNKKLFNVTKFEKHNFTLNNIIKICFAAFLLTCRVVPCHARLTGPTIRPSRARLNRACRAWHDRSEARLGHSPVQASAQHGPLTFVPSRDRARPILSCLPI